MPKTLLLLTLLALALGAGLTAGPPAYAYSPPTASITIRVSTTPAGSPQAFAFQSSFGVFQLSDGQSSVHANLATGSYRVSLPPTLGWNLDAITCSGYRSPWDLSQATLNVDLYPGMNVDCTFATRKLTRYVALGDSIPYGTGLANPETQTLSGLPPNQGPSPLAYPSLIAAHFGYTQVLRPTGCSLTGDQLAVSGAAETRANVIGNDEDCPDVNFGSTHLSTRLHKAVDPEELAAANLAKDPPALVTIQAGGDDIDFADCFEAELSFGLLSPYCTTGPAGSRVADSVTRSRLQRLESGLDKTLSTIEAQAPGARIALVNYYQIAPSPNTPSVNDGSLVCGLFKLYGAAYQAQLREDSSLLVNAINQALADVAARHPRVQLVDISHAFDGKEMCTAGAVVFTDPLWRSAHPTAAGQQIIANAIEAALAP